MAGIYVVSFGSGFVAGKLKLASVDKLRNSGISVLNRNLESRVPGYGFLLQKYREWERRQLFRAIYRNRVVKSMFIIFLNNWIVSNLTMVVRTVFVAPLILYPYGRFFQGLTFAQAPVTYSTWAVFFGEFGGYFLTICGTLCALIWTILYGRFGFASRKKAVTRGLAFLGIMVFLSGFFILFSSYIETLSILGMSVR